MTTFHRICLKDETVTDGKNSLTLKRGKEYLTSKEKEDGTITVFSSFWASGIPAAWFGGERQFTN